MENPTVTTYTVEELFSLKPEIAESSINSSALLLTSDSTLSIQSANNGFWEKYGLYLLIGSLVAISGIGFYIYYKQQQQKKK